MPRMASQTFTFFFTTDPHRATDRSLPATWSTPPVTSSEQRPFAWVKA